MSNQSSSMMGAQERALGNHEEDMDEFNPVRLGAEFVQEEEQRRNDWHSHKRAGKLRDMQRELHASRKKHRRSLPHAKMAPNTETHIGLSDLMSVNIGFEALAQKAGVSIPDWIIDEVENVICLFVSLSGQTSTEGAIATILLWLKKRFSMSITAKVAGYLRNLFSEGVTTQGGVLDETPSWLRAVRDARMNWNMCKNNKAFGQVSKLLGLLVTLGLCKASNLEFKLNEFVIFAPQLQSKHSTAFDLMDATFETILFFVEGIYLCFMTKSLKPLMVSDHSALQLDEEYARLMSWWDLVKVGNLNRVLNISDQEFERRLNDLSGNLKGLIGSLTGFDKKLVTDKFERILKLQNDFVTMKIASGVRAAPFAIEVFGESSQGKTTFLDQMLDALSVSADLPTDKNFRCAYNAGDKYMSNWKTDNTILIFDDIANEKSNFVERPPTRAILDVINNQMFYANKAELEAKGKCFVEPAIVAATTNKKDLDAYLYSNCPFSVQRRFIVVTLSVKDEFKKMIDGVDCGIDSSKVRKFYTVDGDYQPPPFDDVWSMTIEVAVKPGALSSTAGYGVLTWNGMKLKDVNMKTAIQFLCYAFDEHRQNQAAILKGMKSREGKIFKCPESGCPHILGICPDHGDAEVCPHCHSITDGDCIHCNRLSADELWEQAEDRVLDAGDVMPDDLEEPELHPPGAVTVQSGTKLGVAFALLKMAAASRLPNFQLWKERVDDKAASLIYEAGRDFLDDFEWINIVPAPIFFSVYDAPENSWKRKVFRFLYQDELQTEYRTQIRWMNAITCTAIIWMNSYCWYKGGNYIMCMLLTAGLIYWHLVFIKTCRSHIEQSLLDYMYDKPLNVSKVVQATRSKYAKYICASGLAIAGLYAVSCWWRTANEDKKKTQGSLSPVTPHEVAARDAEKSVWTQVSNRPLPMTELSRTVMPDVLQGVIDKNLFCCLIDMGDGSPGQLNAFFVRSNVVVVPSHYFDDIGDCLNCTMYKDNPYSSGGKFAVRLERRTSYHVPGTDLMMCYSPNGGSFRDMTKHFPTDVYDDKINFHMSYRHHNGKMIYAQGNGKGAMITVKETFPDGTRRPKYVYPGYEYVKSLSMPTFKGLCGAVLHSESQGSIILGFHLAGVATENTGYAGTITQKQLEIGYDALREIEGVLITGSAEKFETKVLGKTVVDTKAVPHPKSPLNFMPRESQVQYYGSCPGMSSSKSDVKVTPISEHVMDVCNEPNIYGPPKMKPEWFGWQTCLANLAIPALPFEYDVLELAIVDYKSDLITVFQSDLWNKVKPLTDVENVSGIPGLKFIDSIKLSTSIGFPLSGTKDKFVFIATKPEDLVEWHALYGGEPTAQELERLSESYQVTKFIPEISEEIERIESCYRKGQRGYPIAKACKKDEILSKEKCRIFYGNAISLTYLIRKYFLPLMRVMQMNPLVSECAVGINSHGPEWDEFYKYVTKHGMDRLIGGDYGKYDQKLPSQLIIAAMRILIDCARCCDYTPEDLGIMEAMVGDIAYAVIAFNGDLIGLTEGTHISGNSLTVIINGICGSLNLRCYYYSVPENRSRRFRDDVALSTYGDDNIGSVSPNQKSFTIKGISGFLKKYGQTYTMPDKESELVDFLPPEEFEFLKRKSVYHPSIGMHLGALSDKSCFKMLHCFIRSKGAPDTELVASAKNIDTALSEWFNHGETHYEIRRQQMKEVARRANIEIYCLNLDKTYADKVEEWKSNYG